MISHFEPAELINKLNKHDVKVYIKDGQLKLLLPWAIEQAPAGAIPLLKELKAQGTKILHHLTATSPFIPENISGISGISESQEGQGFQGRRYFGDTDSQGINTSGPLLIKVHGPPESKTPDRWKKLHRGTVTACRKAIKTGDSQAGELFVDACYFSTVARYFHEKAKSKTAKRPDDRQHATREAKRFLYLLENMRYPKPKSKE